MQKSIRGMNKNRKRIQGKIRYEVILYVCLTEETERRLKLAIANFQKGVK